ncbi:MAG: porin [Burkholderia sp.]|jgi:predicted porin|nr:MULTISPECIES: porin [Burkholderia]MBY8608806.1 porin [Burkholderia arboris]MCA3780514.1 porin [Burkholderia sp.]MCA3788826.1 porin [Burkholderia sp.]MCA3803839.1 porin [Burkholderia sp.]MCA3807135.1 porin [Burkholderia sp.]
MLNAAAAGSAQAQSSVTLYGSLDAGVAYVNNRAGSPQAVMLQGVMQPDRIGFVGTEDLGAGWRAVFRLENGFATNTGALMRSGTLFNRQAYVGLSSERAGTITLGQQTAFNYDWLAPMGNGFQSANLLAAHPGNLDELVETTSAQQSNVVKYRSPAWYGVKVGLLFGFGGVPGNFSSGRIVGAGIDYANGPFGIAAAYVNEHDRPLGAMLGDTTAGLGLSTFQGRPALSYVADKVENAGIGLRYDWGNVRLHALYTMAKLRSGARADTYRTIDSGVAWQATPANAVSGGVSTTTFIGRRYVSATLGDVFALSKRTQVYLHAVAQQATGAADARAAIFSIGASGTQRQVVIVAGVHHLF